MLAAFHPAVPAQLGPACCRSNPATPERGAGTPASPTVRECRPQHGAVCSCRRESSEIHGAQRGQDAMTGTADCGEQGPSLGRTGRPVRARLRGPGRRSGRSPLSRERNLQRAGLRCDRRRGRAVPVEVARGSLTTPGPPSPGRRRWGSTPADPAFSSRSRRWHAHQHYQSVSQSARDTVARRPDARQVAGRGQMLAARCYGTTVTGQRAAFTSRPASEPTNR